MSCRECGAESGAVCGECYDAMVAKVARHDNASARVHMELDRERKASNAAASKVLELKSLLRLAVTIFGSVEQSWAKEWSEKAQKACGS